MCYTILYSPRTLVASQRSLALPWRLFRPTKYYALRFRSSTSLYMLLLALYGLRPLTIRLVVL